MTLPNADNRFLACALGVCLRAEPDFVPPVFASEPQALKQALERIAPGDHDAGHAGELFAQPDRKLRFRRQRSAGAPLA